MKRISAIALTVLFCFAALTACSTAKDTTSDLSDTSTATVDNAESREGEDVQIPNPWTDCASLDELNAAAGSALHTPAGLDVTDENYSYLSGDAYTLAQYVFSYNGGEYTLRTAATQEDISGVYQGGKTLTELAGDNDGVMTTDGNGLWAHWFDGDTQVSLYATGASAEDYTAVRAALQNAE